MDPYKIVGRPNWSPDLPFDGVDVSDEAKRLLNVDMGSCYFQEYLWSMRKEPALFLRLDIQDFKDPESAKILKGFLEYSSRSDGQRRVAVLVCTADERLKYRGFLANIICSGVKWQER